MLGDEIGKGAYGRVYKGLDLENGDFVAIKQVSLENIAQEDLNIIMVCPIIFSFSSLSHVTPSSFSLLLMSSGRFFWNSMDLVISHICRRLYIKVVVNNKYNLSKNYLGCF